MNARFRIGDPVEVKRVELNGELWLPAIVIAIGRRGIGVAFADGTRSTIEINRNMLRPVPKGIPPMNQTERQRQERERRLRLILDWLAEGRAMLALTLAWRLDVSIRTIYRDIAILRAAGHRIAGSAGMGGGVMFEAEAMNAKPPEDRGNPLDEANGCFWGALISGVLWVLILGAALWMFFSEAPAAADERVHEAVVKQDRTLAEIAASVTDMDIETKGVANFEARVALLAIQRARLELQMIDLGRDTASLDAVYIDVDTALKRFMAAKAAATGED